MLFVLGNKIGAIAKNYAMFEMVFLQPIYEASIQIKTEVSHIWWVSGRGSPLCGSGHGVWHWESISHWPGHRARAWVDHLLLPVPRPRQQSQTRFCSKVNTYLVNYCIMVRSTSRSTCVFKGKLYNFKKNKNFLNN